MRLYHNDNRISTAVKVKSGSILQVYPVKRQFTTEVEWQQHWEENLKPKFILRFGKAKEAASAPAPAPVAAPAPAPVAAPAPAPAAAPAKPKAPKKASLKDWFVTKSNGFHVNLPAGTYYIGDLCYVLGDDVYDNIFGGTGYSPGIYSEKATRRVFLVGHTAYGDGRYPGSDGNSFAVDAGIIGICSKSLMAKNDGGGHMYTFNYPVRCSIREGRFTFSDGETRILVDTTGDDDAY